MFCMPDPTMLTAGKAVGADHAGGPHLRGHRLDEPDGGGEVGAADGETDVRRGFRQARG